MTVYPISRSTVYAIPMSAAQIALCVRALGRLPGQSEHEDELIRGTVQHLGASFNPTAHPAYLPLVKPTGVRALLGASS